ncbi:hypothetical protein NDK50_15125 [Paraburkholderia bryophila]|uniref:hypothetical protein n=1 Tax=Paraburkholderia bryophila TaxID=420952 RepID=UPI00234BE74D|nr:hypothetical protein [Paraburkholderia bryophila]WCM18762.1 hypothetical protein NDK50_15125 [Paraburkholderia bryophila]
MAVLFRLMNRSIARMLRSRGRVPVGDMRMVIGFLGLPGPMVLRGLPVMGGRVFVVSRSVFVMLAWMFSVRGHRKLRVEKDVRRCRLRSSQRRKSSLIGFACPSVSSIS